jgi:hypothetical protein
VVSTVAFEGVGSTYVFAYIGIADKKLRAQILLGDDFMVCKRDGAYAGEYEVLCDFVGEGLDRDEEDVGSANSVCVNKSSE